MEVKVWRRRSSCTRKRKKFHHKNHGDEEQRKEWKWVQKKGENLLRSFRVRWWEFWKLNFQHRIEYKKVFISNVFFSVSNVSSSSDTVEKGLRMMGRNIKSTILMNIVMKKKSIKSFSRRQFLKEFWGFTNWQIFSLFFFFSKKFIQKSFYLNWISLV